MPLLDVPDVCYNGCSRGHKLNLVGDESGDSCQPAGAEAMPDSNAAACSDADLEVAANV